MKYPEKEGTVSTSQLTGWVGAFGKIFCKLKNAQTEKF